MFSGAELAGQIDEDELLAELEALKEPEILHGEVVQDEDITDEIVLPSVPSHPVVLAETDTVAEQNNPKAQTEQRERALVSE